MKRNKQDIKNEPSQAKTAKILPIISVSERSIVNSNKIETSENFPNTIHSHRLKSAKNVTEFCFNKKRVKVLSNAIEVPKSNVGGILYWMSRDVRVQDNWALLFAQKVALKFEQPLVVVFCLVPRFLNATIRHYKFLLKGLEEVEQDFHSLNIPFQLLLGPSVKRIPEFVKKYNIGAIICDFSPLRVPLQWIDDVKSAIPKNIPLIQVDAHNIVPAWIASEKQEYGARTIRKKINEKLKDYLTEYPPSVDAVKWAVPGYRAACSQLECFIKKRLKLYNEKRNDPNVNALSGLSPWFHFGHISVQRCILEVCCYKSQYKASVDAFCEEAIVRRELAENFCFYNTNYDNLQGINSWAIKTLDDHRKDKRDYVYTFEELENSHTHDDLWNAAQLQLVNEGKMHSFLRMYWAKKILEWTVTPEQAIKYAIVLNDKFSLDGRDPNGYVGCMWSIGGIHDQGWKERYVFGKIRYMNYDGCKRKFNVNAFVRKYGAKIYNKKGQ